MKRFFAVLVCLSTLLSLLCGCKDNEALRVSYAIQDDEDNQYFFMNRTYALSADETDTEPNELAAAKKWLENNLLNSAGTKASAFDFNYNGVSFAESIADWHCGDISSEEKEDRIDYLVEYTQDAQPLTVCVQATLYKAYAVIEWTVFLKNTGDTDTGVITDFNAISSDFGKGAERKLTTFKGALNQSDAFMAGQTSLSEGDTVELSGNTGKPSVENAPYFNLEWEDSSAAWGKTGVLFSVGWPGQWYASIENSADAVTVEARQQKLETYLTPGEQLRSPLMTLLFWEKDLMRSQNLWRRWLYNVAMYQPDGEVIKPMLAGNTSDLTGLAQGATTENQLSGIQLWLDAGLDIDAWQMDAGWYEGGASGWMQSVGGWTPDPDRFGSGLSPISEKLKENHLEFILWFEPERVSNGTEWAKELSEKDYLLRIPSQGNNIINLSDNEVADWLIDYMTNKVKENGVTIYRQDLCIDGNTGGIGLFWNTKDTENRIGITENKYVVNYLRYLDAMNDATGNFLDICATGGRRMDLESMKRGVALWRNDVCFTPVATQSHSWGINFFMPYSGQGTLDESEGMQYSFRSNLMPFMQLAWHVNTSYQYDAIGSRYKARIAEFRGYQDYLTADYYPLTAFSKEENAWMAWQFNSAEQDSGIIQVFRRAESQQTDDRFFLSGLNADTEYLLENADGGSVTMSGRELMCEGVSLHIDNPSTALIIYYAPVQQ